MRDLSCVIGHRGQRQIAPEQGAILALVAQLNLRFAALPDRGSHLTHTGLALVALQQKLWVAPQHIRSTVACDALKGGVHILQHQRIGLPCQQHDAVGRGLHSTAAEPVRFLSGSATRLLLEVGQGKAHIRDHLLQQLAQVFIKEPSLGSVERQAAHNAPVYAQGIACARRKSVAPKVLVLLRQQRVGQQIIAEVGLAPHQRPLHQRA